MLSSVTCSTPPFPRSPSPSPILPSIHHHPHHLLQPITTTTTTHNIKNFKPIQSKSKPKPKPKPTIFLYNLSLQFYVNAALMEEAQALFNQMQYKTLITWTILMSGYTRHNDPFKTLHLFQILIQDHSNLSLQPDSFVYAIVFRACTASLNLDFGRQLHSRILKTDGVVDLYVENAVVTMYASCGAISDAARVFKGISQPDVVSWSSMLSGYEENGLEENGLRLFVEMMKDGTRPDVSALSIIFRACTKLWCLEFGIQVHSYVIKMGFDSFLFLNNTILNFYAKCGDLGSSMLIFEMMPKRNLVSWNTIITGGVHNLDNHESLRAFRALMNEDLKCDEFTLASVLQAITDLGALGYGREVHGYIIRAGFGSNLHVTSSLLDMYIEFMEDNILYPMCSDVPLKIFNNLEGEENDEFIIASILKWCSLQQDVDTGQTLHSQIIKLDLQSDPYIISSLIDMYWKCGIPEAAHRVFERVKDKGTIPWSVIIAGYVSNGWFEEALGLFRRMQFDYVQANEYIYTSVLVACLSLRDLKISKAIHSKTLRTGYGSTISVVCSLINLYSELDHLRQALELCSLIPETDISWASIINSCLRIQDHETVLKLVQRIHLSCGKLNSTSVCYILQACANPVLLSAGVQIHAYVTKRGLMSNPITSNSLIKMYSGCGMIDDAVAAFQSMPEKSSDSWTEIISANADHGRPFEAIELFAKMCRKNKSPNSTTFTAVLKAFSHTTLVGGAFGMFMSMDRLYRVNPSIEHYSCMVEILGRAGRFQCAREFIMGSIPFKPPSVVWRSLLTASRIHGNVKVAKFAAERLLELEPSDLTAKLLLEQCLFSAGMWGDASKLKTKNKLNRENSSWIAIKNNVYKFTSDQIPASDVSTKLLEMELNMQERGYIADRNHLLHDAEEEYYGVGLHHTEMMALSFALLSLPHGTPIRIIKNVCMCGDCHSAFKFMSTFLDRKILVRDSCCFHHFSDGKCSCKDKW